MGRGDREEWTGDRGRGRVDEGERTGEGKTGSDVEREEKLDWRAVWSGKTGFNDPASRKGISEFLLGTKIKQIEQIFNDLTFTRKGEGP